MLQVGDILLKIDQRQYHTSSFPSRHHVMLVIGISAKGHPLIAHMKFTNFQQKTGKLVIESCPHCKDLDLIHIPAFSKKVRDQIALIATHAHRNNKLIISEEFLEAEYEKSELYRFRDRFGNSVDLNKLFAQSFKASSVLTEESLLISCHDFVLSTIQLACHQVNEQVPAGLNIAPGLAWSDILYASADSDNSLIISDIKSLIPPVSESVQFLARASSSSSTFFESKKPVKTKKSCKHLGCVLL